MAKFFFELDPDFHQPYSFINSLIFETSEIKSYKKRCMKSQIIGWIEKPSNLGLKFPKFGDASTDASPDFS